MPISTQRTITAAAMAGRIAVVEGDIVALKVDAVVNAANEGLRGGGGVDGAIHRAAGPALMTECRALGRCPTGEARLTRGYKLPARHIIHAVGPIWHGGVRGEDALLDSCYRHAMRLAAEHGLASLAFPAISTGVYRFPLERATRIAVAAVTDMLVQHDSIKTVTFCCFNRDAVDVYHRELKRIGAAA